MRNVEEPLNTTARRKQWMTSTGIALMVVSLPLWVVLPIIPFLPLSVEERATFAGGLIILAEILFWCGAALAGPAAVRRMKSWWRSTPEPTEPSQASD